MPIPRRLLLLAVTPFETAIAGLLTVSGAASLGHFGVHDPVMALLPGWEAVTLSVLTMVSGGMMLAGGLLAHRAVLTAGLLCLIGVVSSRFLIYGEFLGYSTAFIVTGLFDFLLVWAAVARLVSLLHHQALIRVTTSPQDERL